jgi:hypothetical protein
MLSSPPSGLTFEEVLYQQPPGQIPRSSGGDWRVYKPGESIRNVKFQPWSRSSDSSLEYESWIRNVPAGDGLLVRRDAGGRIPPFAFVRARDSRSRALGYEGIPKFKVKIFGPTDLKSVTDELHRQASPEPVVLIPFSCNDGSPARGPVIDIDVSRTVDFPVVGD